jgi:hypothetical protein
LRPFFDESDQDFVKTESEKPRPYKIDRLFNDLIYRSELVLENNNLMHIFEVHTFISNQFSEKKLMIDALN